MAQPNFERMLNENNISFRIPTPVFGEGLIESITEDTIIANQSAEGAWKQFLGVSGTPNRSGNDGSITRFGWKAQNKSLLDVRGRGLQRGNGDHERDFSRMSADILRRKSRLAA